MYLIRHGQTDWNAVGRWQGHVGPGLNQVGRKQAENSGQKLADTGISALFCSDLPRAVETADIISTSIDCKPIVWESLRERDCGEWCGKTNEQISQENPGIEMKMGMDSDRDSDGVETWIAFRDRSIEAFQQALEQEKGDIALVTHGGVIYSILSYIDPATHFNVPENCNITVLLDDEKLSIESLSL